MCPKEERAIALPLDQSTNADPLSYRGFNRQGELMNDGIFLFSSSSIEILPGVSRVVFFHTCVVLLVEWGMAVSNGWKKKKLVNRNLKALFS